MTRRLTGILVGLVCALVVVLSGAGPAQAHASLVSTDPADGAVLPEAPQEVLLTFSEPVSIGAEAVGLYDADGEPLETAASARDAEVRLDLPDELDRGSYVVVYRVVSADGHPITGSLTFAVGEASANIADPKGPGEDAGGIRHVLSVTGAAGYVGLFLTVGLTLFWAVLLPSAQRRAPAGRRLIRLVRIAGVITAAAWLLLLPVRSVYQQGLGFEALVEPGSWFLAGADLVATAVISLGLAAVLVGLRLTGRAAALERSALFVGVALLVVGPALSGHTRVFSPELPVIVTDVLHVLAGSVWLGGLVALAVTLPGLAGRVQGLELLTRFSTVAAGVLALLTVSGVLLAWRIVGSWQNLVDETYGWLLIAKVAVAVLVIAIAAANRLWLLPRAQRAVGHGEQKRRVLGIGTVVRWEAALVVAVLAITAVMVNEPPRGTASEAAQAGSEVQTLNLGEARAHLTVAPGTVGANTVQIHVEYPEGVDVVKPTLAVGSDRLDLGVQRLEIVGHWMWTAEVVLPSTGDWDFRVGLKLSRFENPVATATIPIA